MHVLIPEPLSFIFAMICMLSFVRESVHVVRKSKISFEQYEFLFACFSFLVQLVNWYYEFENTLHPDFSLLAWDAFPNLNSCWGKMRRKSAPTKPFILYLTPPSSMGHWGIDPWNLTSASIVGHKYAFLSLMDFLLALLSRCRPFSSADTRYLVGFDAVLS